MCFAEEVAQQSCMFQNGCIQPSEDEFDEYAMVMCIAVILITYVLSSRPANVFTS